MTAPLKKTRLGNANAWMSIFAVNVRFYRSEILGVVAFAIVGVCLFLGWLALSGPRRGINWGFGPDWDCSYTGNASSLVCIKPVPKHSP
jgi:hypothetical protein